MTSPLGSALSASGGSQAVEEEDLQPPGCLVRALVVRQLLCQQRAQDDDVARCVATRTQAPPPLDADARAAFIAKSRALTPDFKTELLPPPGAK